MRDAILQVTSALLAQDNPDPSLDEIAAIVGVTKRAVQGYFSSTAGIENELIAHLDPENPRS